MNKIPAAVVVVVGVIGITVLELYALHKGIDGAMLSLSFAGIAALVAGFCGFKLPDIFRK